MVTSVRVDARSLWSATLESRALRWVVVLVVLGLVVLDAGSVFMTRLSLTDDGHQAGRAVARAVTGLPMTPATAETGYEAALGVTGEKDGVTVRKTDFEVLPNGGVTLTVVRTAPTLVVQRVSWLEHFGVVEVSVVVEKPVA
jgi:hypothetical protein